MVHRIVHVMLVVLAGTTIAGCSGARFVPNEPVSTTNAARVRLAVALKVANPPWLYRLYGGGDTISNVAVDSQRHMIYVHRKCDLDLYWYRPVGIEAFDAASGRQLGFTRIPGPDGIHGREIISGGPSYFDLPHGVAYLIVGPPGRPRAITALDLRKDDPQVVPGSEHFTLAPHPEIDAQRLLIVQRKVLRDVGVGYLDRNMRTIAGRAALATPKSEDWIIRGGCGDIVLAWKCGYGGAASELAAFASAAGELGRQQRVILPDCWRPVWDDVYDSGRKWLVYEECDAGATRPARVRIYDVPSLGIVSEYALPESERWRRLKWLPTAHLLLANPVAGVRNTLLVYDTARWTLLTRLHFDQIWHDDLAGSWDPVGDSEGTYLGGCGTHWVQLFGVIPSDGRSD